MRCTINKTHVEGYVYDHKLDVKVAGERAKNPGVEFISGQLNIAVDEECTNVIPVYFRYVAEKTKDGKPNITYSILKNIIDEKIGSVIAYGKENAGKVRIDSAIGLNEWYNFREPDAPLVSTKRNEGGFIHQVAELCSPKARATFNTDIVITKATRIEADEERNRPEKVIVRGCIFDYKKALLPVEFSVTLPQAMDYFEGLGASPSAPVFTKVQGIQISQTVTREIKEDGAFGDPVVREVKNSYKDFVINWAKQEPYMWDSEEDILASELSKAMQEREIYLAELKRNQEEYRENSEANAFSPSGLTAAPKKDNYDF